MEIKNALKKFDVKISKFAKDLKVSRPTLDNYIDNYEKGRILANGKVQSFFDALFSKETDSVLDFQTKYEIARHMFINNNSSTGNLNEQHIKMLQTEKILYELNKSDTNVDLLNFVNLVSTNKDLEIVRFISNYFNYINGHKKLELENLSDTEGAFLSELYQLFDSYKKGTLVTNPFSINNILDKNLEKINKRNKIISDEDF